MPKKRILPFIILGILKQNPGFTGKEITYQFKNEIGEFWKASHSQVYPELKKMEQDNWITSNQSDKNEKEIYYSITENGEKILNSWISEPITQIPVSRDLFSLKMFFISDPTDPRIKELVEEELELLKKQLDHLKKREKAVFKNKEDKNLHYGHYVILKRAMARLQGQIEWLKTIK
ncbi:PadR family transcriptional regulator [Lactobacillus sp. PV037]|uniref:helix-turn-helix transcriptional regulator n=1 Tax=Lactobacillus sp. PV037 TaxID=2594496 RepID=UPI0022404E53|nr:helix-turn-helix transcriptional regulator [Lactobacillus sp. PV037]QNQ84226.1 PadR family transcriptional regulator [Lactobacillus sp. PV037]